MPTPTSLHTPMKPPLCLTIPYAVESPNPVPLPLSLVVKNGSKIFGITASLIPTPVSEMEIITNEPGCIP